jgi:cephalosporin hydroxylase
MDPLEQFEFEKMQRIKTQGQNIPLIKAAENFNELSIKSLYSYNFSWMGRPIMQYPQDMVVLQEIIWTVKPDLIIETGIAHGGSIIFYASILELIGKGEVLGIDVEIRPHNRRAIEAHPMFKRITMIEGDSVSKDVVAQVDRIAREKQTVLVCLDSNHTHEHVLNEIELYSPYVTKGSYLIVFDTIVEDLPENFYPDRPWGRKNNPKTAVRDFIKKTDRFLIDKSINNKLMITVAPEGYLKCVINPTKGL